MVDNKKIALYFACILFVILNVGCSSAIKDNTPVETITWYTDNPTLEQEENALNRMLKKKELPYAVDFVTIEYTNDYFEKGELPDTSGADIVTNPGNMAFHDFYIEQARNGELLNLSDYLYSEEGAALLGSMPERVFRQTELEGVLWAFPNPFSGIARKTFVSFNEEVLDELEIEVPDSITFQEYADILRKAKSLRKWDDWMIGTGPPISGGGIRNFYSASTTIGIYPEDGEWKVDWKLDIPWYRENLEELHRLVQEGCIYGIPGAIEEGRFFAMINRSQDKEALRTSIQSFTPVPLRIVEMPELDIYPDRPSTTWIRAKSEHAQSALKLMEAIYTDQELCELLVYGEGFQVVGKQIKSERSRFSELGNLFLIRPPVNIGLPFLEAVIPMYPDMEPGDIDGFHPYITLYDEMRAVEEAMYPYEQLLMSYSDNWDDDLGKMRRDFELAGGYELLERIRVLLDEYLEQG